MTPYICKTNDNVEYGWIDCLFKQPHTNIENSVRLENETVIGFAEFEETDEDKKLWNTWLDSIESQYE